MAVWSVHMRRRLAGRHSKRPRRGFILSSLSSSPILQTTMTRNDHDVALITSVQDGTNLVSLEFVACQDPHNGVLVLSQFTGSAQALKGAVPINPSNMIEVAAEIGRALVMPLNERKKRHEDNFQYVATHTTELWAERFVRLLATSGGIMFRENITKVATFPIGVDSHKFMEAVKLGEVQAQTKKLKKQYGGKKVVVGVDRLDTIKGLPNKYLAFEKFLQDNPDLCEKVILVQIALPSTTDLPQYQRLTHQVHELVGRINGRFSTLVGPPLRHLDCSLDFNAFGAPYAIADVALITSVQDGTNLVSHKFVACQDPHNGVLVLSQFTGSAQALKDAVLINPSNTTEVAAEIGRALVMPLNERQKRHEDTFNILPLIQRNYGLKDLLDRKGAQ